MKDELNATPSSPVTGDASPLPLSGEHKSLAAADLGSGSRSREDGEAPGIEDAMKFLNANFAGQGIEAGTATTAGRGAKHESPVGEADAPNPVRDTAGLKARLPVAKQVDYARAMASGQDDPHSITISDLCDTIDRLEAEITALREPVVTSEMVEAGADASESLYHGRDNEELAAIYLAMRRAEREGLA